MKRYNRTSGTDLNYKLLWDIFLGAPCIWPIVQRTIYIVHSPTLRPKCTHTPFNCHKPPIVGSIYLIPINTYIQLTYISQIIGSIYPIQIYILRNAHSPTDNCWQHISNNNVSNYHLFPNGWDYLSNTNIYFTKCIFSNPAPEGCTHTDTYWHVHSIYPNTITITITINL